MKKVFIFLGILGLLIGYCACRGADKTIESSMARPGIPASAELAAEDEYYEIFLNEEVPAKDWTEVAKVSLWLYNKSAKKSSKLLTTVNPESFSWYVSDADEGSAYPIDSITAIDKVIPVDSTTLIVEGVPDLRNRFSYIIDIPNRKATTLPCNAGVAGFTTEEGLIIGQSYRYVSDPDIAGRYTYIQIFDWEGNQVADLDLEREHLKSGVMDLYLDFTPQTELNLKSYTADCDFRFPVEYDQRCWEYVYTFDKLAEEDIKAIDKRVLSDKNWKKTNSGYHYTYIDKDYSLNADLDIDLKNKRWTFIHGIGNMPLPEQDDEE